MTPDQKLAAQELATDLAREMYDENFESRRGCAIVEDTQFFYFYDNNPYADKARRPTEHAEFHAELALVGAEHVATGTYPVEGESAGYTVVHVYSCMDPEAAERRLHEIFVDVVMGRRRRVS